MVCVGTCDKNNLPWFVVGYDIYPTRLYIPGYSHITMRYDSHMIPVI